MQKCLNKIIAIIFIACFQNIDIQAQNQIAQKADSLFNAKNYLEAAKIYELIYTDKSVNKENISLKLAFIYEQLADYPRTLFYLNTYYNKKPSDQVFDKMNKIALENKFSGFERNDINFILMLYQRYFIIILYALIAIGVWILVILFRKKINHLTINRRHVIVAFVYLIFLITIINAPDGYKSGIVNKNTYLRTLASGAAPIQGEIKIGNRINIFGQEDIWYRVLINKKVTYINKNDIWVIGN